MLERVIYWGCCFGTANGLVLWRISLAGIVWRESNSKVESELFVRQRRWTAREPGPVTRPELHSGRFLERISGGQLSLVSVRCLNCALYLLSYGREAPKVSLVFLSLTFQYLDQPANKMQAARSQDFNLTIPSNISHPRDSFLNTSQNVDVSFWVNLIPCRC